ncbi:MAG: hypothetical protein WB676_01900 [Bryobacteraceae bacterium]
MNCSLRLALIVNTFVLIAGSVSGKSVTAFTSAQTISIHLYDHAQVTAGVLHSATDETSRLFRAARIQISWECPSTESPEDQGTDMSSAVLEQLDRRYIVVRLIRRAPGNVFPGALGYALPFAHTGAHVLIFYDRVETLAHTMNESTYIIFGHAMAHEIGHVLLRSSEHTSGGLMQARWTPETWRLASSGLLAFTREEAEHMDEGLRKFQIRQVWPVQQPTLISSPLRRSPE